MSWPPLQSPWLTKYHVRKVKTKTSCFSILLLLALGAVAAYAPSLHSPFLFDDRNNILENLSLQPTGGGLESLVRALRPPGLNVRPLAFLTFALNFRFGGEDPFGFHLVNLGILLLSIPAAFWLARLLSRSWQPEGQTLALALATAATILWVSNPLLTNGVTYIVQRMTALSVLFSLVALASFVKGWQESGRLWYVVSALAWGLAIGTKESALIMPLPALLYAWLVSPPRSARARWTGAALGGGIVVSQAALLFFSPWFAAFKWIPTWPFSPMERFLTEGRVVARYLSLFLWPLPSRLNLDPQITVSHSLLAPPSTLLAFALHGALIAIALQLRRVRPLLAYCVLSFYLLQLAEGTFLPLDLIFEHRVYLPSFFLALGFADLVVWGLGRFAQVRAEQALLLFAVLTGVFWGALTHQRNRIWADPVLLWQDVVAKSPAVARARINLGLALNDAGRHEEAIATLRGSIEIDEANPLAYVNLGIAFESLGRYEEAIAAQRKALALQPNSFRAYNGLSVIFGKLGRLREAEENARLALAFQPNCAEALSNLGNVLFMKQEYQEAVARYREALRLRPGFPTARENLAFVLKILGEQSRGVRPAPEPAR